MYRVTGMRNTYHSYDDNNAPSPHDVYEVIFTLMLGSNTLNYTWPPILSALDIIISIVRKGCMLKKFSGCRHFCVTVLFLLCSCLCMSAELTMTDSVLSNNLNNSHICILINLETVGKNSFISESVDIYEYKS